MAGPAYFDAFRRIVVQPDNITISADAVDDTLTLVAGAGISLVANANSDQITIVNTNSGQFSLAVAGDDSTLRTINSGETIRFAGTGGVTVTSNAEGAITINGPNLAAVSQNIIPTADVTYDIGSSTNRFRDIYLSGSTIYLGSTTVGVTSAGQLVVSEEYTGGEGIGGIASVEWTNASEIEIRTEDDSPYIDKLESLKIGDTFTFLTGSSGTFPPNTIVTVSGAVTKTNTVSGFFDFVIPVLQSPVSNVFVYTFTITRKPITDISQLSNDSGYLTSWSFNVAGDDSTLRTIDKGETIKFIGASNVTVTTDAEGNITITGPNLSSYLTSIPNDVTIGGVRINTNLIQTVDSNADLELDASGTGAIQLRSRLKLSDGTSPDGLWTNFTPTWTAATTNPTIGNGLLEGTYKRVGNTVHVWMMMIAGSTTTFGSGEYKISLPVTARAISRAVLSLVMNNDGTRLYNSLAHNAYTTSLSLDSDNVTLFWDTGVVTHNSPFAWASGDWFIISGTYEAS